VSDAEKYVLAAYVVVLGVVLAYLLIISLKVSRLDRELGELARRAQAKRAEEPEREEAAVG
jgi:hypothetical protein